MTFEQIKQTAVAQWGALTRAAGGLILVGGGTCGMTVGATELIECLSTEVKKNSLDAAVVEVGCIGWCDLEPFVIVAKPNRPQVLYDNVSPDALARIVPDHLINGNPVSDLVCCTLGEIGLDGTPDISDLPFYKDQQRTLLRNCGKINPEDINHYIALGGYDGLAKALEMSTDDVIGKIRSSGLRGCGGAGFSTADKLLICRDAESNDKYIVCNASEGDPSATKDRCLMEGDPHGVIEGILIAAYAVGASRAHICINPEYALANQRLQVALSQMTDLGLLGDSILGSDFSLRIEIKQGQGLFVCGEESALISFLECGVARPKTRPPYPAVQGLNEKPTLVCNVETFANISSVLSHNSPIKQTKLLTLSGGMRRSGVVEVPMDMTLRKIVMDISGGGTDKKNIKTVQVGGPTGTWLTPDQLDVAIDFDSLAKAGTFPGSGSVYVATEDRCAVDLAKSVLDFIHLECCGKCVFGREGTRQLADILSDIAKGSGRTKDVDLLEELGASMKIGALCGLGKDAPNPVLSLITSFRSEFEAHIRNKKCPASVCS